MVYRAAVTATKSDNTEWYRGRRICGATSRGNIRTKAPWEYALDKAGQAPNSLFFDTWKSGELESTVAQEDLCFVQKESGTRLTPSISSIYATRVSGPDYDVVNRHQGWILIGDFILIGSSDEVRLWIEDPPSTDDVLDFEAAVSTSIRLCKDDSSGNFEGNTVRGYRFIDWINAPTISEPYFERKEHGWDFMGPTDAIAGAARIFVEGFGWRFLFPNAMGPSSALEHLRSTSSTDDLREIARLFSNATRSERDLVIRHFQVVARGGIAPFPSAFGRGLKPEECDKAEIWRDGKCYSTSPDLTLLTKVEQVLGTQ
jgi:hypothetical protein